eukprot:3110393-Amphidinium_carterae.1
MQGFLECSVRFRRDNSRWTSVERPLRIASPIMTPMDHLQCLTRPLSLRGANLTHTHFLLLGCLALSLTSVPEQLRRTASRKRVLSTPHSMVTVSFVGTSVAAGVARSCGVLVRYVNRWPRYRHLGQQHPAARQCPAQAF